MKTDLPPKLSDTLMSAQGRIDVDGQLPPAERKQILECIEELSISEHAQAGYLRRARLGMLCAARTMEKIKGFPDLQHESAQIWYHTLDALSGKYELSALERDAGAYHADVVDLLEYGDTAFAAVYSGMATLAAANVALYDIDWSIVGDADIDVEPDDWTPWFFSSLSESGGAVWEEKGGAEERRRYWMWFIETAVPLAWQVTTPLELSR